MTNKIKNALYILKITGFKYYRAKQIANKPIHYLINGVKVTLLGNSLVSMIKEIVTDDSYQMKGQKKVDVIFDVGANVGVFSIHAATLYPNAKIYAFEPDYDNYQILLKNTEKFKNIYCFNKAIGNKDGRAFMAANTDNTAYQLNNDESGNSCEVFTLSTALNNIAEKHIDILKLDCEGSEYEILEDIVEDVAVITGEFHELEKKLPEQLNEKLIVQGFKIEKWKPFLTGNCGIFYATRKKKC